MSWTVTSAVIVVAVVAALLVSEIVLFVKDRQSAAAKEPTLLIHDMSARVSSFPNVALQWTLYDVNFWQCHVPHEAAVGSWAAWLIYQVQTCYERFRTLTVLSIQLFRRRHAIQVPLRFYRPNSTCGACIILPLGNTKDASSVEAGSIKRSFESNAMCIVVRPPDVLQVSGSELFAIVLASEWKAWDF